MKKVKSKKNRVAAFGKMIREKRRALGMSSECLAEKANRSEREVRDIELGKVEPKLSTTLLLCNACEVDVGELEAYVPHEE